MSLLLTRYIFVIFKYASAVITMCTRRASFDDWREISELRKLKIVPRHVYALERRARSHGVSHHVTCFATEDIPLSAKSRIGMFDISIDQASRAIAGTANESMQDWIWH